MENKGGLIKKRWIRGTTITLLSAVLLLPAACSRGPESLVILFSNDTHGTFQPHKLQDGGRVRLVGGMEAASHHIRRIREQEKNVLLADTGDIMTGTMAARIPYRGVAGGAMPEFLNLLGYDIRCHGNHAFDLGIENALANEGLTKTPMVMANIVYEETGKLFARNAYRILRKGRLKIGVIAVMEEFFLQEVREDRIRGLDVRPIIPTLRRYVPEMERRSDLVVVLLHSKFHVGRKIAVSVPGVDIILVASEDGRFEEMGGVLVKSTYGHQRTLGYLKLNVQGGRILDYREDLIWLWADADLEPDPAVSRLVLEVENSIEAEFARVIGNSDFDYSCPDYGSLENALGNWITDVMRWKTGARIALQNSGGIRADLYAGPITRRDIYHVSPFRNTLVTFQLSGSQLKRMLERDIERGRDRLQISGFSYLYHSREARPFGRRVERILVGDDLVVDHGRLLLPELTFNAVSNDYVVGQAEHKYFGFILKNVLSTDLSLDRILVEWLEENKSLKCSVEDRIVELKPGRLSD